MAEENASPNLVRWIVVGLLVVAAFLLGKLTGDLGQTGTKVQETPASLAPAVLSPEKWAKISEGPLAKGPSGAQIILVEFSDFQCPACGGAYPAVKKILSDYSGKVRLVFQHFPLNFHPLARPAAYASECAAEQGKFWEYHDKIFENQPALSEENLKKWAKDLSLNLSDFNSCLDNQKHKIKVDEGVSLGNEIGVGGTPTFYVNEKEVSWNSQTEGWESALRRYIEAELE